MILNGDILTDCTMCYHSCGCKVTVENGRAVKVQGLDSHPVNKGGLCPKGAQILESVYHPERIKTPLRRTVNGFVPATWDEALDDIAGRLDKLKKTYGPQVLGLFCGSVGVENFEMAGLTQRFKSAFGSPNFFSVESVCYRMRIRTRQITFGKYPTEEMDAKLYLLWGHNPHASDFPLKNALEQNLKKGAKLVVIDPRRIPMADKADIYTPIRPGTDGALALAMINVIVKQGLYDRAFIEKYTVGFKRLVAHIKPFTPEWAAPITGVDADTTRKIARMFASIKGAGIYQGTCTQDQTANGTQNSRAFAVLQIITGNINVPGGWVISPRPYLGNVGLSSDGDPLGTQDYPLFVKMWGRKSPYGVVTLVPEAIPEKLKAFLVAGGNPLVSMPDSNAFKEAFAKLDLLVVHDMFMTETARAAHWVLPGCSHLEKWGLAYNYNVCHCIPYLMLRKKCIQPVGESWSEWKLFTELAKRLGLEKYFPWTSEEELVSFELASSGLTFEGLLNDMPQGTYYREKAYMLTGDMLKTPSGKIEIYSQTLADAGFDPLPTYLEPLKSPLRRNRKYLKKYPLVLGTGNRNMFYTHSQHRNIAGLRDQNPAPTAELGPETASRFGIENGAEIRVTTDRGEVKMKARVDSDIAENLVFVPHGWGGEANANLLTDVNCREPILGYPDMKSLLCSVAPI